MQLVPQTPMAMPTKIPHLMQLVPQTPMAMPTKFHIQCNLSPKPLCPSTSKLHLRFHISALLLCLTNTLATLDYDVPTPGRNVLLVVLSRQKGVQNQSSGMRHILALSEGDAHFLNGAFQGIQDFIWVLFRCPEHVVQSLQNKAVSSLLDSVL